MPKQNEVKFQKELVDVCKACGGIGQRLQRQFLKGIADDLLKHPKLPAAWVEVKHVVYVKQPKTIEVNTTSHQRIFLRDWRKAGMLAGWIVFITVGRKHYYITSMGQIYAKTVTLPKELMPWTKTENDLLTILQTL